MTAPVFNLPVVSGIATEANLEAQINAGFTTLYDGTVAEAAARAAADTTIQSNITAEQSARIAAVSAEATTRAAADTALQAAIDAEEAARIAAISGEEATRIAADDSLDTRAQALEARIPERTTTDLAPDLLRFEAAHADGRLRVLGAWGEDAVLRLPALEADSLGPEIDAVQAAVVPGGAAVTDLDPATHVFAAPGPDGRLREVAAFTASGALRTPTGVSDPAIPILQADVSALNARLVNVVGTGAQPLTPDWGLWRLRRSRMKIRRLLAGEADQLHIGLIGDSNTYLGHYPTPFTAALRDLVGAAGPGFCNTLTPYNRVSASAVEVSLSPTGTWSDIGVSGNSVVTPTLGHIRSSTPGSRLTFTFPANSPFTEVTLSYGQTVDGAAQYRWNGGAWISADLTAGTAGEAARLAMNGIPGGGVTTLEIEVVSGTCNIGGVDPRTAGSGVVVHKLGFNGARADHWSGRNEAQFVATMADLDLDLAIISLATNDQLSTTPAAVATAISTVATRLRAARPLLDILIVAPAENLLGRALAMAEITAAVRAMCVTQRLPFLDLQYFFGDTTAEYNTESAHNWMPDGVHYNATLGGPAVAEAVFRALTQSAG
jgi:hypothetical protein